MLLFTAGKNSQVALVVNFIPTNFLSSPQIVSKVTLHTGLNVYRESSGGSQYSLVCYKCHKQDLFHAPM